MATNPRIIETEKAIQRLLEGLEAQTGQEVSGVYVEAVEVGVCQDGVLQMQRHIRIEMRMPAGARWAPLGQSPVDDRSGLFMRR